MINDADNFQVQQLGKQDLLLFQEMIQLFETVFETERPVKAGATYLQTRLDNPGFIVLVAMEADLIVGGLTAFELPMYYAEKSELFIYDIAVDPRFQRRGIGKKLLLSLKEYCRKKGVGEFFVAAHEEDTHALDFYQSTGGIPGKVVHFDYDVEQ
ncbi:MAG: GNAT family N-acetyltransferase [Bacteroidota bacterium]